MLKIVSGMQFIPVPSHSGKWYLSVAVLLFVLWHLAECFQLIKKLITIFVPEKNALISDIESNTAWEKSYTWSAKMFWNAILQFLAFMRTP